MNRKLAPNLEAPATGTPPAATSRATATRTEPPLAQSAILRIDPAARYIGVSRSMLYVLIERGELLRLKLGGRAAGVRRVDLDDWLTAQAGG